MNGHDLAPGYYLVGRHDGEVEPFFVRVQLNTLGRREAHHHADSCDVICAAVDAGGAWWWQRMAVDDVPNSWAGFPTSPRGRRG